MVKQLPVSLIGRAHWPARDQAAWERACQPVGFLAEETSLQSFPLERRHVIEQAYSRWLGFLATTMPPDQIRSGIDWLDQTHLQSFVDLLSAHVAPYTVRHYLTNLLTAINHMAPSQDHRALIQAVRHAARTAKRQGNKTIRMVPARDLYAWGFELMRTAKTRSTPLKRTAQFRDGLMIAMLIARPLRLANFAAIELDRHLTCQDGVYWLSFTAKEVKTRRPLQFALPSELGSAVDDYLHHHRGLLLERRGGWWRAHNGKALWISDHGTPCAAKQISARIRKRTAAKFGRSINPHLFRDCAATSIAIEDPEHVGIIAPVLGHSNALTAERYYNQARTMQAVNRYQDTLARLLQELAP